jgi:hypothetical protein
MPEENNRLFTDVRTPDLTTLPADDEGMVASLVQSLVLILASNRPVRL